MHLPFGRGPRSLRVLGPLPDLVVKNLTSHLTNDQALEGTVNRTLLLLQAGPNETCVDIEISTSCFSILLTSAGATKRLVSDEELQSPEMENGLNMTDSRCRTPIMVEDSQDTGESDSGFGYSLPAGYKPSGTGQRRNVMRISSLGPGQNRLLPIDFFRPAVCLQRSGPDNEVHDESLGDRSLCKTDIYVTIKYKQKRPQPKVPKRNRRRSSRKRPVMPSSTGETPVESESQPNEQSPDLYDEVELEHSGSITWATPLTAQFPTTSKTSSPSGIRHPLNSVHGAPAASSDQEIVVVDEQIVPVRCSLSLDPSMAELKTELLSIRFEVRKSALFFGTVSLTQRNTKQDTNESKQPFSVSLLPEGTESFVFRSESHNRPILSKGTTFGANCSLKPVLKGSTTESGARSVLGYFVAEWNPIPFDVADLNGTFDSEITAHGPLALPTPCTIRFPGPLCYVERAPFEVCTLDVNPPPTVGIPFVVAHKITNKTRYHQTIDVHLNRTNQTSLLLSGIIGSKLSISPFEDELVSFVFLSTSAGATTLPSLRISSDRFDSWVVNSVPGDRQLFIFP